MKTKHQVFTIFGVLMISFPLLGLFSERSNPPIENQVQWDSPQTQEIFYRACADCHSHETKYPWYSYLAPASFLVAQNIEEGRLAFNISFEDMGEAEEAGEEVLEGKMPPNDYLLLHPEAKLSDSQKQKFAKGLIQTFGGDESK